MNDTKYLKATETKKRILDESLKLFLEEGYDRTTMRKIALLANVTPGATYYYFKTKEHIVFHYYEKSYDDHLEGVTEVLRSKTGLQERLAGVIKAHIYIARPYQDIARALFKIAANPEHPLSPFSEESKYLRDKNIEIFRDVIDGATDKAPDILKEKLPDILFLFKVGIILYWIFDYSPEQSKTIKLIDKTSDWLVKIIKIANFPVLRNFTIQFLALLDEFQPY